jgi:hypothetical protein
LSKGAERPSAGIKLIRESFARFGFKLELVLDEFRCCLRALGSLRNAVGARLGGSSVRG